ncbi:MAG: flavin reductase family protein [Oscillospiraceae bacterium]|jgi:flavin reductase (DIM6/NTAB) family NADH-FMN oxidoreductase RutF|nr:flavin reductase family protein [Oscillospiraceae bacterium]
MTGFKAFTKQDLPFNPLIALDDEWMLISAEKDGKANTMTASWGGFGILWSKPVAYIVLRPQRYTKEFVDAAERFSLSFFGGGQKKALGYLGTVSGRDSDKISQTGLTLKSENGVPYFEEAKTVLVCKKLFRQPMTAESFVVPEVARVNYPGGDFHTLYIGEIEQIRL